MKIEEVVKRIDTRLFMKQKEWLAKQVAILEPSGEEKHAEGILNLMDQLQDTEEFCSIHTELNETDEINNLCPHCAELNETKEVNDLCPHCECEVDMKWNVKEQGLYAKCPHCGKPFMLCNYCPATDPESSEDCDYSVSTNSCRYKQDVS